MPGLTVPQQPGSDVADLEGRKTYWTRTDKSLAGCCRQTSAACAATPCSAVQVVMTILRGIGQFSAIPAEALTTTTAKAAPTPSATTIPSTCHRLHWIKMSGLGCRAPLPASHAFPGNRIRPRPPRTATTVQCCGSVAGFARRIALTDTRCPYTPWPCSRSLKSACAGERKLPHPPRIASPARHVHLMGSPAGGRAARSRATAAAWAARAATAATRTTFPAVRRSPVS